MNFNQRIEKIKPYLDVWMQNKSMSNVEVQTEVVDLYTTFIWEAKTKRTGEVKPQLGCGTCFDRFVRALLKEYKPVKTKQNGKRKPRPRTKQSRG